MATANVDLQVSSMATANVDLQAPTLSEVRLWLHGCRC
jgi:hypothetical protein